MSGEPVSRRGFFLGPMRRLGRVAHVVAPPASQPRDPGRSVAQVQVAACLAHTGSFCFTCVERCPVEGAMRLELGRPVVDPDLCDGCGVCQNVCPAPQKAIVIRPPSNEPKRSPT